MTPGLPQVTGLDFSRTGDGALPLVVLHGLGGARRQPLEFIDARARQRCGVIAPDLRGHGSTRLDDRSGLLTFRQLAADVEDLVNEQAGPSGVVVLGISMGAAVAAELAARATITIRAMLLIRPAWLWSPGPPNLAPLPVIGRLLHHHLPPRARELFTGTGEYQAVHRTSPAAARALLAQFDDPDAARRWHRLVAIPADAPGRPRAAPPTRILAAAHDPVHPLQIAETLAADLGADLSVVPPRYEQPAQHRAAVTAALHEFLGGLEPSRSSGRAISQADPQPWRPQ